MLYAKYPTDMDKGGLVISLKSIMKCGLGWRKCEVHCPLVRARHHFVFFILPSIILTGF